MSSSSVSSDSFNIDSHYTEEQANPEIDPETNPDIDPEIDPENYPDNFNVMLTQKQAVLEIDQPVPEIDQRNDPDNYNFNEAITQKQPIPEIDRINDPGNYKEVPTQKQPVPDFDPEIYPENDPDNDNLSMHAENLLCKEVVNVEEMLDGKPESLTGNLAKRIQKGAELPGFWNGRCCSFTTNY